MSILWIKIYKSNDDSQLEQVGHFSLCIASDATGSSFYLRPLNILYCCLQDEQ